MILSEKVALDERDDQKDEEERRKHDKGNVYRKKASFGAQRIYEKGYVYELNGN